MGYATGLWVMSRDYVLCHWVLGYGFCHWVVGYVPDSLGYGLHRLVIGSVTGLWIMVLSYGLCHWVMGYVTGLGYSHSEDQ